jgi:hypothetical protein
MTELTKKLKYKKAGTTEEVACLLYDSSDACKEPSLKLKVDGSPCYAKLGSISHSKASGIRIKRKGNDEVYAVLKSAYVTFSIPQTANQTVTVTCDGKDYTSTFNAPIGSAWSAAVNPADHYKGGTLSATEGIVDDDFSITITDAIAQTVNVTIVQSAHQTIHVYTPKKDGGIDHTESFVVDIGTPYEAEIIAEKGYTAGKLIVTGGGS